MVARGFPQGVRRVNLEPTIHRKHLPSAGTVIKPETQVGENEAITCLHQNSVLGKGTNAQENCLLSIPGSKATTLAHGARLIDAQLEENVFVGFNFFIHGS
jgi:carbonic anhydrase/acetyltransferase-like protein (isoleucine patch superfamily)